MRTLAFPVEIGSGSTFIPIITHRAIGRQFAEERWSRILAARGIGDVTNLGKPRISRDFCGAIAVSRGDTCTTAGDTRVRKDIRCLTRDELQLYREKLDDVLRVGRLKSHWQELGLLRQFIREDAL